MSDEFLMKGKVYAEHKHKLVYPVVAEVKYDEIRLHVRRFVNARNYHVLEFLSYSGKPLHNLDRWADQFKQYMIVHNLYDLDCGLEVNGNFNDSYRWSRSSTGIPKEKLDKKTGKIAPALNVGMVRFVLFDIPQYQQPFRERRVLLDSACAAARLMDIPMDRPESWVVQDEAELDAKFIERRELDDEGLMVKDLVHKYIAGVGKRIDGWLKMKPEETADGKISRVNQAVSIEGVPLDRAGSVDVVLEDFSIASPAGIPHELGRLMWAHPEDYVGKQWVEFKYMERDRQGGYRHPSLVRLREAK